MLRDGAVMRFSFLILLGRSSEAVARAGALQSASQEPESPGGASVAQENASLRQELTSTRQYLQWLSAVSITLYRQSFGWPGGARQAF
jgi:hypothetical protein